MMRALSVALHVAEGGDMRVPEGMTILPPRSTHPLAQNERFDVI